MRKQILKFTFILGLLALGLFIFLPHQAAASNPATISFQGKVVNSNGTNVTDGTYSFIFRIYNASSPTMTTACTSTASCLWQETQASVTVTSGIFQVELGSSCALTSSSCNNTAGGPISFATNNALYLTMQFNGDTSGANGGFMSPLIHMNSAPFALQADNAASLGGIAASGFVQLGATQSGNINLGTGSVTAGSLDSNGSAVALNIGATNAGTITLGNTTSSSFLFKTKQVAAAFQVQNASGNEIMTIDTSATEANNFLRLGKTSTINGRIVFDNSTNANTITIVSGVTSSSYTLTLPTGGATGSLCLQSTSGSTASATDLQFGSCSGSSSTFASIYDASTSTNNDITLTGAGGGLSIKDASSPIGASLFNVAANNGTSNFFNVAANSVTVQSSTANSSTAFSIQNAAGSPVLLVDTTSTDNAGNQLNYLKYSGFESGSFSNDTAGWIKIGNASATITQNTSKSHTYNGLYSALVHTTANSGDGLKTTAANSFTATAAANVYIVSAYFKMSSGTMAGNLLTFRINDGADHDCSPSASVTINPSGFQRLSCSVTTTANAVNLQIFQNTAAAKDFYVDSVQLQTNDYDGGSNNISSPTAYNIGNLQLRGTITAPIVLATNSDSIGALQIFNTSGTSVFSVDTLNSIVVASGLLQGTGGLTASGTITLAGTAGNTFTIGNSTGAGTIASGGTSSWTNTSGNLTIQTATSGTLGLDSAAAITVGGTNATGITEGNTTNTSAWAVQGTAAATYTIGNTNTTGTITLGKSTATNTISIGSASPADTKTQTINIGNGSISTTNSGGVIINLASGSVSGGVNGGGVTVNIANGVQSGAQDVSAVNIGAGNSAGAGVVNVTIGSVGALANTLLLQGGNGATAIQLSQASGGTITIGITTGSSGVVIQAGTGRITLKGQIKVAQSGTALTNSSLAESGAGAPTLGTGSTDTAGSFTTSTTSHTTITLTFSATMTNAPFCTVVPGNSAAGTIAGTSYYVTTTATTLVVNMAASTTASQWIYHCFTR